MAFADQYTYFDVETSKYRSWDAHITKVIASKSHIGKMDAILKDSHLDTKKG